MNFLEDPKDFRFSGISGKQHKKTISLVILTTRLEAKQDKAPTVQKMLDKSQSMGFRCIVIDTAQGEIERNESGNFFIRNKGDQKKF